MKSYQVVSADGFQDIRFIEQAEPEIQADEILVKMKACSLNYRDLLIPLGGYPRNENRPVVPLSDGAGEVVRVGADVKTIKTGQRVVGNFFQDWTEGEVGDKGLWSALGGSIDGTLSEYFILKEQGALTIPDYLSYQEAATLPCAAVTAWHALVSLGNIKSGDRILLLGTGGVSVFGLQIAKAFGAEVIISSSSDEKLERAKAMGADHTINYKSNENWHEAVLDITDGEGVDNVLEVGGPGTFEKSARSTRIGGIISMIGILTGFEGAAFDLGIALNLQKINGIYVGSTSMFRDLLDCMEKQQIKPVVDSSFSFENAMEAYSLLSSAGHFGKIVISNE